MQQEHLFLHVKQQLLAAYEEVSRETPPSQLEEQRQRFIKHFPPDRLVELKGQDLLFFLHGPSAKQGLCYELEFGEPDDGTAKGLAPRIGWTTFGSIGGGFAGKFKVYRAVSGVWKRVRPDNGIEEVSEEKAIEIAETIAREMWEAHRLAVDLKLETGEKEAWKSFHSKVSSLAQLTWVHKYLFILHPDLFSFHHNEDQLRRHLVRLGTRPEETRWLLEWQWRQVRLGDPDLRELHPCNLGKAAYKLFGTMTRYWRISAPDLWPAMRDGGYVCHGWRVLGDLREQLASVGPDAVKARLGELLAPYCKDPQEKAEAARLLNAFLVEMAPEDRLVAVDQAQQIVGVGVIKGNYEHVEGDDHPHRRIAEWAAVEPRALPDALPVATISPYDFSKKYATALLAESLLTSATRLPADAPSPPHVLPTPTPLTETEERIRTILERKGQVILYGPPGTGKTWHAHRVAQELISRELYEGLAWGQIGKERQPEVERRIHSCTFHPAYAYEDFVEGYRPRLSPSGHPYFETEPGIFQKVCEQARQEPGSHHILIIDEINRGNVPAIMGELISLLEADKRETLKVILPVSKQEFTIPRNVWLIGTMNTADRSISLLDAALRRRFGFYELLPDPSLVSVVVDGLDIKALLTELNRRIRKHVPRNARELQIGHAYFMPGGHPPTTPEHLLHVMRDEVIPLLSEYCFENFALLRDILSPEIIDSELQRVRPELQNDAQMLHNALRKLVPLDHAEPPPAPDTDETLEEVEA